METKVKWCKTRKELAEKYFPLGTEVYSRGDMAIVALLSDVQEQIAMGFSDRSKEEYRTILNDIKSVLIEDHKKEINNGKEK